MREGVTKLTWLDPRIVLHGRVLSERGEWPILAIGTERQTLHARGRQRVAVTMVPCAGGGIDLEQSSRMLHAVMPEPLMPAGFGPDALYYYGDRAHVMGQAPMATLATVADTADVRAGNRGHCWRVAQYVDALLRTLDAPPATAALIADAARLHDIGTVDLPAAMLTKREPLAAGELALLHTHVQRGAEHLARVPGTDAMRDLVLHHHERVDGGGYPDGLRGDNVPWGSRVIAVADSFDIMTHAHPYRRAEFLARAISILAQGCGTYWDREVVIPFVTVTVPHLIRETRLMVSSDGLFECSHGRI